MVTQHALIDQNGTTYLVQGDGSGGIEFIDEDGTTYSLTIDGSGDVTVIDEGATTYLWGSTVVTPTLGRYQHTGNLLRGYAMESIVDALEHYLDGEVPVVWDNAPGVTWLGRGVGGDPEVLRMGEFAELSTHRSDAPTVYVAVSVRFGAGRMRELGSLAQVEIGGELVIDLHAELAVGTGVADELIDVLGQYVQDYTDEELRLFTPSLSQPQRVDDAGTNDSSGASTWTIRLTTPFRTVDDRPARPNTTVSLTPSISEFGESVRERWRSLIEVPSAIPTAYDNEQQVETANSMWARLSVLTGDTDRVEAGVGGARRVPGIMKASLFAPIGTGDSALLALADEVYDSFAGLSESRVTFGAPNLTRAVRDGVSWRLDIRVPFTFDEV